jgi:hypothetical protein
LAAGYISWDVNFPGTAGQFDITNGTGPNSTPFPDTTFPIVTQLALSGLSLTVHFTDGSTSVFGPAYFSLALDGESMNGSPIPIGGLNPLPTSATLTGNLSPLAITLNDGTTTTILPGFTATILPDAGSRTLVDGDLAIIMTNTGSTTAPVPEPATIVLVGLGVAGAMRRRRQS